MGFVWCSTQRPNAFEIAYNHYASRLSGYALPETTTLLSKIRPLGEGSSKFVPWDTLTHAALGIPAPPAPPAPPLRYEAESLARATSGPSAGVNTETGPSGGKYVQFNAGGVGDWIEFTLPDVPRGTYDVLFKYKTHSRNRGIHDFAADGELLGSTTNQLQSGAGVFPEKNVGTVRFDTGDHVVRLTLVGTTSSIQNYGATADRFSLLKDVIPPQIDPHENIEGVEATSPEGAVVHFTATATDNKDGAVPVLADPSSGSVFPPGTTKVNLTATDFGGNKGTGAFTVEVVDTTAPVIQSLTPSSSALWPPNHGMVPVRVAAAVSDAVDMAPATRIVAVTSNEPVDGTGDGDTAPDWIITGDLTVDLRAERAGTGAGRVYTITVESRDLSGNASTGTLAVSVPRNQGVH